MQTRHDVMVPLGPMAFMPGELVHTNEIMVLLGDNYFAERSGTQATQIMQRRIEVIDDIIRRTEKKIKDLAARDTFSHEARQVDPSLSLPTRLRRRRRPSGPRGPVTPRVGVTPRVTDCCHTAHQCDTAHWFHSRARCHSLGPEPCDGRVQRRRREQGVTRSEARPGMHARTGGRERRERAGGIGCPLR